MNSFQKTITAFSLFTLIATSLPTSTVHAADPSLSTLTKTTDLWDRGTHHVVKYASDVPIKFLGFVGDHLLATIASDQHQWFFNNTFVPVHGTDAAKALGYSKYITSESLLSVPKKSLCTKYKDTISTLSVTDTQTLCLRSTLGGDYTINLMPEDRKISVGFGKQPILEKNKFTWIGIDGNLYIAYLHPNFFNSTVTAIKTKTNPAVFLLRNGVKYSIPNEKIYYSWFDSFKTVTLADTKKLATYTHIRNISYRANTLLRFKGESVIYVYQPVNDPYTIYGKETKITEDAKDHWTLQSTKSKTPIILKKRPELLRPLASESDAIDLLGSIWDKKVIELAVEEKSSFTISDKPFNATTDFIIE